MGHITGHRAAVGQLESVRFEVVCAFHLRRVKRDAGLCLDMRGFNTGHGQCSGIGGVVMQARAIRCGDADFQQVAARWRIICAVCRANHKRVFRIAARTTDPDLLPYRGRQPDAECPCAGDVPADPGGQQPAGTSAATAQSYTGHLRFDEFFWTGNFINLRKVAGAMATLKGLTRTYFSTPSSESHEAYQFWTGDRWNAGRPKAQRVDFDVTWKKTHSGVLYPDKTWRQIVTIQDAVNNGWMHTIIDDIRDENSPDEFENLYMCEFVKDGESAFNLSQLLACGVDGYDDWPDWKPFAGRPMGQREVWLGYDANGGSGNGDAGALSVTVPPLVAGGRFRTVELKQLRGLEFEQQAAVIKEAAERYNVTHIAIDGQGVGEAVWQIVKNWFPAAICYQMSLSSKRALVLKMLQVIRAGRWEYDRSEQGLVRAFNAVRKVVTPGGFITYETDRSRGVSHGDMAWATMLSIINEPLGQESGGGGFAMGW